MGGIETNKGSYILLIEIKKDCIVNLHHKEIKINKGLYAYIGSAMKNLYQRVGRHMTYKEKAYQKHWHIDGILENKANKIIFIAMLPSHKRLEEDISKEFAQKFQFIEGFGASDLTVKSNLYLIDNIDYFFEIIKNFIL
ncbi:GIY-YIG nuclease family protein [Petrotoga sp. DB-2]